MVTYFLFALLFSFLQITLCSYRFVFTMCRHGARQPIFFQNSTFDLLGEEWLEREELTEVGKRQHYLLGYWNRERYKRFIDRYSSKEIYVMSTDVNRTIMSVFSQLHGWFPPKTGSIIDERLTKTAVPPIPYNYSAEQTRIGNYPLPEGVESFPVHLFNIKLKMHYLFNLCPAASKITSKRKELDKVKNYTRRFNSQFGEKLRKIMNITDVGYFENYDNVHNVGDTFYADYTAGRGLQSLVSAEISKDDFRNLAMEGLAIDILDIKSGDKTLSTIISSPIGLELVKWMDTRVDYDRKGKGYEGSSSPKVVIYSMHDDNLSMLMTYLRNVLREFDNPDYDYYPQFAASINIELHLSDFTVPSNAKPEDYYVIISFNSIQLMNITYIDFQEKIKDQSYTEDEIRRYCGFESEGSFNYFIVISAVLGLIAIIELIIILHKKGVVSTEKFVN